MSDESRVRVEHLMLFYDGQPADLAAATQPTELNRVSISGSVQGDGNKARDSEGVQGEEDGERKSTEDEIKRRKELGWDPYDDSMGDMGMSAPLFCCGDPCCLFVAAVAAVVCVLGACVPREV